MFVVIILLESIDRHSSRQREKNALAVLCGVSFFKEGGTQTPFFPIKKSHIQASN